MDLFFFFYGGTLLRWKHGDSLVVPTVFLKYNGRQSLSIEPAPILDSGDTLSLLLRLAFKLSFFIKLSVKDVSFDPEPLHP